MCFFNIQKVKNKKYVFRKTRSTVVEKLVSLYRKSI